MTPSQREAHLRMMMSLPVRTHLRDPDESERRQGIFRGQVIYKGKTYPSLAALRRVLRVGHKATEEMLMKGEIRLI